MTVQTLFRPVNQAELDLIAALEWKTFPPRLPEQPIFYPVLNEQYAIDISKRWNVSGYSKGYVVKFEVLAAYLQKFEVQNVGLDYHNELWIPAEELAAFNANIVGLIEVTQEF